MSERHWATALIGLPWSPQHDCWWLVRKVFAERYGIQLPPVRVGDLGDVTNVAAIRQASQDSGWCPAEGDPTDGDIALMRGMDGARHVGVIIETRQGRRLLHSAGQMTARGPTGSVVSQDLRDATHGIYTELELWRRKNPRK